MNFNRTVFTIVWERERGGARGQEWDGDRYCGNGVGTGTGTAGMGGDGDKLVTVPIQLSTAYTIPYLMLVR